MVITGFTIQRWDGYGPDLHFTTNQNQNLIFIHQLELAGYTSHWMEVKESFMITQIQIG